MGLQSFSVKVLIVCVAIGLLFGAAIGYLLLPRQDISGLQDEVDQLMLEVDSLRKTNSGLLDEVDHLRLEVDALRKANSRLEARLNPLSGQTVGIGVIAPATGDMKYVEAIISLAEDDINAYYQDLGYNVTFDFPVEDARGEVPVHSQKLEDFNAMGIKLVIGGDWCSQADCSHETYIKNNQLILSPSCRSALLSIPGDNVFRMSPSEFRQVPLIAETLRSLDIRAVVILQRGDYWGDAMWQTFKAEYESRGGVIAERVRYPIEGSPVVLNGSLVLDLSRYLEKAENATQSAVLRFGKDHVAALALSLDETVDLSKWARMFPTIYNFTWLGTEETALKQQFIDSAPEELGHLRLLSPAIHVKKSDGYLSLSERYAALTNGTLTFYRANWYDAAWLYAKAVLEAGTTNSTVIKRMLPQVASQHFGVTGWSKLDANGDREFVDFEIWGYDMVNGTTKNVLYGFYEGLTGNVTWYYDQLPLNLYSQG